MAPCCPNPLPLDVTHRRRVDAVGIDLDLDHGVEVVR